MMAARRMILFFSFLVFASCDLTATINPDPDNNDGHLPRIILAQDVPVNDFSVIYCHPIGQNKSDFFMDAQFYYQHFIQQLRLPNYPFVMGAWRNLADLTIALVGQMKTNPSITPFERGVLLGKVGYFSFLLGSHDYYQRALSFFADALKTGCLPDNLCQAIHKKMYHIYNGQGRFALALRHLSDCIITDPNPNNILFLSRYVEAHWNDVRGSFYIEWPLAFLCDWFEREQNRDMAAYFYALSGQTALIYSPTFQIQQGDFYTDLFHQSNGDEGYRIRALFSYDQAKIINPYLEYVLKERIGALQPGGAHPLQSGRRQSL